MASGKEYTAIRRLEVNGFFMSRAKACVAILLFVSLLIAVVVLAALLVHERGKENTAQAAGDSGGTQGKRNKCSLPNYSSRVIRLPSESNCLFVHTNIKFPALLVLRDLI